MFYIYSIVIPLLILALNYLVTKAKPTKVSGYVNLLLKSLLHLWGYVFFLYYLEQEKNIYTGGADLGLFVFLTPVTILVLLLAIFYWVKNNKR